MGSPSRALVAGLLLVLGVVALLFATGEAAGCLGPAGVTEVECAKARGSIPGVGIGLPLLALAILVATLIVVPPAGRRWHASIGAVLGGAIGATAFLVLRPTRMEGFTSTGAWLSIHLHLDMAALTTAIIVGAWLGMIGCVVAGYLAVRAPRVIARGARRCRG